MVLITRYVKISIFQMYLLIPGIVQSAQSFYKKFESTTNLYETELCNVIKLSPEHFFSQDQLQKAIEKKIRPESPGEKTEGESTCVAAEVKKLSERYTQTSQSFFHTSFDDMVRCVLQYEFDPLIEEQTLACGYGVGGFAGLYAFIVKDTGSCAGICFFHKFLHSKDHRTSCQYEIMRLVHPDYRQQKIGTSMYAFVKELLERETHICLYNEALPLEVFSKIDETNDCSLGSMRKYGEPLGFKEVGIEWWGNCKQLIFSLQKQEYEV